MVEVGPQVRESMAEHSGFSEIGKGMLLAWQEGMAALRGKRTYAMGDTNLGEAFTTLSDPEPVKAERRVIGRSDLIGRNQ